MNKELESLIRRLDLMSLRLPYQVKAGMDVAERAGESFWSGVMECYGETGVRILIHALLVRNNKSQSFFARKQ